MGSTITNTSGTNASRMSESTTSLRIASTTPPMSSTGMVMRLPEMSDATHETVPTSCVERVRSAAVPSPLNSSKLMLLTRENTAARRSPLKFATIPALSLRPAMSAASPTAATSSILAQQRTI